MNNWRIINKIAFVFGLVLIVFTALAAFINYEFDRSYYTSAAPAGITIYSILAAMLPFLLAAVFSFVVYALTLHAAKSVAEKEPEAQKKKTQEQETQEAEKQPDLEGSF
jgi:mannitol-specific phosphotransferase system IIBC component